MSASNSSSAFSRGATAFAIAAALMVSAPAPAAAQSGADIYVDAQTGDDGRPLAVFVISDSAGGAYAPRDTFTVGVDENGACVADFDATAEIAAENREEPIYGPSSSRRFGPQLQFDRLDVMQLPSYFSREAAAQLIKRGLIGSEADAVPYFNCVGQTWALVLSQPAPADPQ